MAKIRIPHSAETILPFCRPAGDSRKFNIFKTYAEAVSFAAAIGYYQKNGAKPTPAKHFMAHSPDPIELEVFRSQRMFPALLALGLSADKSQAVAKDEDRLCAIVEGYAHEGFVHMSHVLKNSTPSSFHRALIDEMRDAHQGVEPPITI